MRRIGSHGAVGRHRRYRGGRRGPHEAATPGARPRARVPRRARARGGRRARARRIGEGGGSNFTFLLERDAGSFVLRRPPRPPLPPSAHDVVREARLQLALREAGFERLPTIVAVCEDETLLGVPFYVMSYLDGVVPTDEAPPGLDEGAPRRALGDDLVDALVEIHAADVGTPALAAFARPGSYNERQARRFAQLWEINKTRELPRVDEVGAWLVGTCPTRSRRRSSTATTGWATRWSGTTIRRGSSPCSTGRWARSATRAPTSATCSRRTASPAARRIRSGRRRSPRLPAFRRARSSSSATSRRAAATSSRSRGSRRSRSGRRPCSARRSTAATSAGSSVPRTRAPRVSSKACRTSRRRGGRDRAR